MFNIDITQNQTAFWALADFYDPTQESEWYILSQKFSTKKKLSIETMMKKI